MARPKNNNFNKPTVRPKKKPKVPPRPPDTVEDTGMTAEQLDAAQRALKADYYRRASRSQVT